jgi:hypothetical protein
LNNGSYSINKIVLEERTMFGVMKPMILNKSEYSSFIRDYTLKKPDFLVKFLCRYEITIFYKNGNRITFGTNGHALRVFSSKIGGGYKGFIFINSENIIKKYWKIPEIYQFKDIK